MPSRVRPGAETSPMSSPRNSIVPEVAGMSPAMTLKRVVFPAPLGPRMARRSPGATSRSTSRTAARPPNRRPTPRKRRIGSTAPLAAASVTSLLDDLHRSGLPGPRQRLLFTARELAPRGRGRGREGAAERLVDRRDLRDGLDRQLLVLHVELLVVDVQLRLAVLVERDVAVGSRQRDLVHGLLQLLLATGDVALDGLQPLDQAPRVDVVAVGEGARRLRRGVTARRDLLEPLADDVVGVVLRRRGVQVAGRARATDVGARDARPELLELTRGAPEQVADELLGV